MTCRQCGRTSWASIAFLFVAALTVKTGAVCGCLWLHNAWLINLVAWGGSIFSGFIFLGAVGGVMDAVRMRHVKNRPALEPSADPALIVHAGNLRSSLFVLTITLGFVLIGNAIGVELATCLGAGIFLFALLLLIAMISTAISSAGKTKFAVPGWWPARKSGRQFRQSMRASLQRIPRRPWRTLLPQVWPR